MIGPQDVTEYSAIALLFLLVVLGWRVLVVWVSGYNERQAAREAAEQARAERDYADRQAMVRQMADLVAADVESKMAFAASMQELVQNVQESNRATVEALQGLAAQLRAHNGSMAEAVSRTCATVEALAKEQRRLAAARK